MEGDICTLLVSITRQPDVDEKQAVQRVVHKVMVTSNEGLFPYFR